MEAAKKSAFSEGATWSKSSQLSGFLGGDAFPSLSVLAACALAQHLAVADATDADSVQEAIAIYSGKRGRHSCYHNCQDSCEEMPFPHIPFLRDLVPASRGMNWNQ